MAVSVKQVREKLKLSPERQEKIAKRSHQLIQEELTLRDLRKAQSLTQERLAEILGIEQDSVSRMERRADLLISTMSSYIQAMGGRMRIMVEFPDREPVAVRLSDLPPTIKKKTKKLTTA
jgi:DNA-binding XRE family transcriptional regulator